MTITGSLESGKTVAKLNVNTCDVPGFTVISGPPCGSIAIIVTELPATFGSQITRGTNIFTFGGTETKLNGSTVNFSDSTVGTAFGFASSGPGVIIVQGLSQFDGVIVTITHPAHP